MKRSTQRAFDQIAYIMSGQDQQVAEAILVAALHSGLCALAATPELCLTAPERVRVDSRLEAVRVASGPVKALLQQFVANRHAGHGCDYEEPPF